MTIRGVKIPTIVGTIHGTVLLSHVKKRLIRLDTQEPIGPRTTEDSEVVNYLGTSDFISELKEIKAAHAQTRTVSAEEALVPVLVEKSIAHLERNNISYSDYFEDRTDPRIAVLALALAEYDQLNHAEAQTRASIGGCVLEALGVRQLGKAALRKIGFSLAVKAVPYVGWGLFALDMADCLIN